MQLEGALCDAMGYGNTENGVGFSKWIDSSGRNAKVTGPSQVSAQVETALCLPDMAFDSKIVGISP